MEKLKLGQPLDKGYYVIKDFADLIVKQTGIDSVLDIEQVMLKFGADIVYYNNISNKEPNFVEIYDENNFKISILNGLDNDFKRLLLIQALGHYLIHSLSGKSPCYIESPSSSPTSKEGFWFALCVTMEDSSFIEQGLNIPDSILSNLYRVPVFAVTAKKKILTNFYQ